MQLGALGGGPLSALIIGAAICLYYGYTEYVEWKRQHQRQPVEEQSGYFVLPPRDAAAEARARATEDALLHAHTDGEQSGNTTSNSSLSLPFVRRRRPALCVVCQELPARWAFVRCGHMCLCEGCLIEYGHDGKGTSKPASGGACRMACPLCRAEGYVIKVYTS